MLSSGGAVTKFRRAQIIERLKEIRKNLSPTLRIDLLSNDRHDSLPGQSKARQKPFDRRSTAENLNVSTAFIKSAFAIYNKHVVLSAPRFEIFHEFDRQN